MVRAALGLGAKLPPDATSAAASSCAPPPAGLHPPAGGLVAHWAPAGACRSMLLEALRTAVALLRRGVAPGTGIGGLASLAGARVALAVARLAAGTRADAAAAVRDGSCVGCGEVVCVGCGEGGCVGCGELG
eukprot:351946-Chlamydomonas_euryale.AAC.5